MGLKINAEKAKTIGKQHEELQMRLGCGMLERVTRFVYLELQRMVDVRRMSSVK